MGGFITPPPEYFWLAVEIARHYGGVFICDEVQTALVAPASTGLASRTGTWSRTS